MKKVIIFVVLSLFLLSFVSAKIGVTGRTAEGICSDSDDGKNYFLKGTATDEIKNQTDECAYCTGLCPEGETEANCSSSCGAVVEFYCDGSEIKNETHVCEDGTCTEGKCTRIATDSNSDDESDDSNSIDDSGSEDEIETEIEDENENELGEELGNITRERIRERDNVRKEFTRTITAENGSRIIIERKVEVKDGEVKIKIKKTIIYADGSKKVIEIEMERNKDGITREIQIEGEGVAIDKELEINDLFEGNESEIEAILSNGNITKIKILPERARIIARERLRNGNISNITLEEIKHRNIPRVVYNVETNQNGRFLGIFKLALKSETQIDPETGEVIDISKPWWAFLVSVPEENTEEDNETDTSGAAGTFEEGSVINGSDEENAAA